MMLIDFASLGSAAMLRRRKTEPSAATKARQSASAARLRNAPLTEPEL